MATQVWHLRYNCKDEGCGEGEDGAIGGVLELKGIVVEDMPNLLVRIISQLY